MKKLILTILLISTLWSCGTRNVKKTEIKEEIKTETETSTKTEESTTEERVIKKSEDSDKTETVENLTPIDPDKPMKKTVEEKDGKKITTWENATVNYNSKIDKSKKSESVDEVVKSDFKRESDFKAVQEGKKTDKVKVTESDKGVVFSWWWIWIIVLIIILKVIYDSRNKQS